jgi:cell division protein ZapA (FtsZ GTPase activity inhibitor)
MAEALGIASSTLTLVDTSVKLVKLIRALKHAPAELLALNNEVADLKLLFSQVQVVQAEQPDALSNLASTLDKTIETISHLSSLVDEYSRRPLTGVNRVRWLLEKSKIVSLKDELRERRSQLDTLLGVNNVYVFPSERLNATSYQTC